MSPEAGIIARMWLLLLIQLHASPSSAFAAALRPPLIHAVPLDQRVLQMESGRPVKSQGRGRLELLRAAWKG